MTGSSVDIDSLAMCKYAESLPGLSVDVMWHDDDIDDKNSHHASIAPADDSRSSSLFARGTEHLLSNRQAAHTSLKQTKQLLAARCSDQACASM